MKSHQEATITHPAAPKPTPHPINTPLAFSGGRGVGEWTCGSGGLVQWRCGREGLGDVGVQVSVAMAEWTNEHASGGVWERCSGGVGKCGNAAMRGGVTG